MRFQNYDKQEIMQWLRSRFSKIENVIELYLIGSMLSKDNIEINDVDIIQEVKFAEKMDIIRHARIIYEIQGSFLKKFSVLLHITSFTQNEQYEMKSFLRKNDYIKLI